MEREPICPSKNNHLLLKLEKNSKKNRQKLEDSNYNIFDIVDFVKDDIHPPFVMPLDRSEGGFCRKEFWDAKEYGCDSSQLRLYPTFKSQSCIKFINGWKKQCNFRFTDKELNIIGNSIKKYFKETYDIDMVVYIKPYNQIHLL